MLPKLVGANCKCLKNMASPTGFEPVLHPRETRLEPFSDALFGETPSEIPCETLARSFRDALPDDFAV